MKKARKPSRVEGEKRPSTGIKKLGNGLASDKLEKPRKRPSGANRIDLKEIQRAIDFRTPFHEWAIPLIQKTGIKATNNNNGIKLEQVTSDFDRAFASLCCFVSQGNFCESAILVPLLMATAQGKVEALEAIFPEFGKLQVTNQIIARFVKGAERNRKTKRDNHFNTPNKDKYRESCENEIFKAVILHKAGWKKHWILEIPFPSYEFGSPAGKNDWRAWIRIYLEAHHRQGLLRANQDTKFSKEGKAKDRSKIRAHYFDVIYSKASLPHFDALINFYHTSLQIEAVLKTHPNCFSFLTIMAMEHPECAPKEFIPQRIKLPEKIF